MYTFPFKYLASKHKCACGLYKDLLSIQIRRISRPKKYKQYPIERMRNIGISAHIDSGKTTLTERILYYTGRIQEMHEVKGKDGIGATMDSMELERQRGITIQSAATSVEWLDHNINIIDTPGHVDFTVEVERALRVLDSAILVVCGVAGVQSQTLTVHKQINRYDVPNMIFINKLDRAGANANNVLQSIRKRLNINAAFITIPIGKESNFRGVIDLINNRAIYFEGQCGETPTYKEIPAEYAAEVMDKRHELIESISNIDDTLGDMFLMEQTPSVSDIQAAIRRSVVSKKFSPVFVGSALRNKGVQPLLDGVVSYFPDPSERKNYAIDNTSSDKESSRVLCLSSRSEIHPLLAFAFKLEAGRFGQLTYLRIYQGLLKKGDFVYNVRTGKRVKIARIVRMHADKMEDIDEAWSGDICAVFGVDCSTGDTFVHTKSSALSMESIHVPDPVISLSFTPSIKQEYENFSKAINRFQREDPTFKIVYDDDTKEIVALGMGELHLEIYAARIEKEFGVKVDLGKPKVAFLETLVEPYHFDYFHKKQTGGQGQFGRVIGILEPLPPSKYTQIEFSVETVGGCIPAQLIPAVKKGFMQSLDRGGLTGHKVRGVKFRLRDGEHHIVDSTEIAFILAAVGAMKDAFAYGKWQILEPVMNVEVMAPSDYHGNIVSQLGKRQATIRGQDLRDGIVIIDCQVSLNDMFGFTTDLRSCTQGKGEFSMEFAQYLPARPDLSSKLIQQYQDELASNLSKGVKKG